MVRSPSGYTRLCSHLAPLSVRQVSFVCVCVCVRAYVCVCARVRVCVCACMCMCLRASVSVNVCARAFIFCNQHTYKERENYDKETRKDHVRPTEGQVQTSLRRRGLCPTNPSDEIPRWPDGNYFLHHFIAIINCD